MDCPHAEGCRQRIPPLQQLQLPFICTECKSSTNLWLCITCSSVYCGRYINAHAKSHNETTNHPITIDCHDLGVYCYECDDYINIKSINVKVIERLQCVLNAKNNSNSPSSKVENENTEPLTVGVRGSKRKCTNRSNSINSDSCSGEKSSGDEGGVKKIKRDNGHTNNNGTNGVVKKHGVVGLRNLGNTCFMNAVLQSLSKINGFSTYMLRIPEVSLENHPVTHYYRTRSRLRPNQTLNASFPVADVMQSTTTTTSTTTTSATSSSTSSNQNQTVIHPEEILTTELCKILNSLNNNSGSSAVSPDALFSIIWSVMPRFRGYQQQDAHEFLRYMLDRLHTELVRLLPHWKSCLTKKGDKNNGVRKALDMMVGDGLLGSFRASTLDMHNSIVTTVFSGELISEVRCCSCGTESKKNDPFLDLSLDITDGEPKLQDCLSRFVDVEELVDNDMYYCSVCNTRQKSTKRFWITKLPNVLCLHLKRFRWSNYLRTKLDHFVEFPMANLDMTSYMLASNGGDKARKPSSNNTNLYDLAAVIVHHGSGVGSGHYTAFAKKDTDWFNFNDSTVKLTQESIVAKAKAYILFYIRREFQM